MRYLIVDDEPIAHRIIEGYCADLPFLEKIGNAYNALEASTIVNKYRTDLIFLDLNMPKMTGFEWLKTLPLPPRIIVTTAYKEYALEGYELDIVDYLLKPFSFSRFLKAVNKVGQTDYAAPAIYGDGEEKSRLFLKGDKKYHHIHLKDILFVEAYGNYSKVYLEEEMIVSHEKISSLESLLADGQFLRVHKSFLVAIDKIKLIQGNQIFIKDHKVPIGQTYKSLVNQLLNA